MRIDVNAFLGAYPWRRVPGTSPSAVLAAMDRVGIDQAWVTHLPGLFWRDPVEGNGWLLEAASREPRFRPVPAVHPELAGWESVLSAARAAGAPAVRCDPTFFGISPGFEVSLPIVAVSTLASQTREPIESRQSMTSRPRSASNRDHSASVTC